MVAWDGPVSGTALRALAKRTPRRARASRVGVSAVVAPYAPTWSGRRVSIVTRRRLGWASFGGCRIGTRSERTRKNATTAADASTTIATRVLRAGLGLRPVDLDGLGFGPLGFGPVGFFTGSALKSTSR
jgi:hypothetical protein